MDGKIIARPFAEDGDGFMKGDGKASAESRNVTTGYSRMDRNPLENLRLFQERRKKVAEKLQDGILIVASPQEVVRNGTTPYPFRQDSNLYYLTGFEEPETIFVMRPGRKPETVLFCRKRNPERETWDGFRFGPENAQRQFQVDAAYPIEEFNQRIVELMKGSQQLYYRFFKNKHVDEKMEQALLDHKMNLGRSGLGLLPIIDADEFLGEFRVIKSDLDLLNHRRACDLTVEAHIETMKYVKPGMNEREVHGNFIYQIMKRGAAREGYNGIVASGPNACTLHYVFNDQTLRDGDMLLIDAAGEYNYFTSDITRTYPVNGQFTDAQAEVYEGVLKVQKAIIEQVRPGVPFAKFHEMASHMLTDVMLELGLLTGRRDDIVQASKHKKYYPHGIGHFLGMDVHDLGRYFNRQNDQREIEPGMVFTIEPGIYIPADDKESAEKYRGIGVRIEDNILVTNSGYEVLTKDCPKEIADLEKIIGSTAR